MRCARCESDAVVDRPYARDHLCGTHFRREVEARVRRDLHRQIPGVGRGTIAVALSGGKDSAVALTLAHRYFGRRRTVRMVAITVDEGIAGYRAPAIERARELTGRLGVEHVIVRAEEQLGTTTDQAAAALPGIAPCSYCGVWRRQLLNRGARDIGADALVLGFNLDDLAQTLLMNLARGDVARIGRMSPHRSRQPGLVPRIAPLASIPEREVFLYAHLNGIPFDHSECPHAGQAARNIFREVVWRLEEELPGTRHALVRTQAKVAALLSAAGPTGAPATCADCGEPATGVRCRACDYLHARRPVAVEIST